MFTSTGPKKLPPFVNIKKEIPNFGNDKFIYIVTDNRGQPIGKPESYLDTVVKDIASQTILNKYVIQYNTNYTHNRPTGIDRPTPLGKNIPLDKLKKIKLNLKKK